MAVPRRLRPQRRKRKEKPAADATMESERESELRGWGWLGRKRRISGLEKREGRREKWIEKKGQKGKKRRKKNKNRKREEHEKHRGNYFHNSAVYNVRLGMLARNKSARLGDMCSTRKTGNRGISKSWLTNDPVTGWLPGRLASWLADRSNFLLVRGEPSGENFPRVPVSFD